MAKLDVTKQFGSAVRVWRRRLGISQEELAGRAGLHRTYVCDVERGARNVSLKSIEKLAQALEVSIPTLLAVPREGAPVGPVSPDELVDILFVEDEQDDIDLAMQALQTAKIANRIHIVHDGAAALNYLFGAEPDEQGAHKNRPDLVLLDLNLPKVNGLEVLRRIKTDPSTRSIPVVVLTVSQQDRDMITSQRLGADAYIIKPVDFQNLTEVTSQLRLQWALLKPVPAAQAS